MSLYIEHLTTADHLMAAGLGCVVVTTLYAGLAVVLNYYHRVTDLIFLLIGVVGCLIMVYALFAMI
jgi:1,4-dihydroxy-2-naphthoate octaprenyltransferase